MINCARKLKFIDDIYKYCSDKQWDKLIVYLANTMYFGLLSNAFLKKSNVLDIIQLFNLPSYLNVIVEFFLGLIVSLLFYQLKKNESENSGSKLELAGKLIGSHKKSRILYIILAFIFYFPTKYLLNWYINCP